MICPQYYYPPQVEKWITKAGDALRDFVLLNPSDPSKKTVGDKLDSLGEKIFESCKFNLRIMVERCDQEANGNRKQLLQIVIGKICHFILNRKDTNGFFYQITNQHGISSYLIGTLHVATAHMFNNPKIKDILNQVSEVITEIGDDSTVIGDHKSVPVDKDCLPIDDVVTYLARERGLAISGLESAAWQKEEFAKAVELTKENKGRNGVDEDYARKHSKYLTLELFAAWQAGDAFEMKLITDCTMGVYIKKFSSDRTVKWVENPHNSLIEKVKAAKLPICIAVGVDHCIGTNGLINFFTTNGLEVKKL